MLRSAGFLQLRQGGDCSLVVVRGPQWLQHAQAQQLWLLSSRARAQWLWCTGLVALWHVRSSRTRDQTVVPFIARQILNHCTTREALFSNFLIVFPTTNGHQQPGNFIKMHNLEPYHRPAKSKTPVMCNVNALLQLSISTKIYMQTIRKS